MTTPNLPANNCNFNLKTVAHVKPFRKDITPEEQERLRTEYFQRLSGERDARTNILREKIKRAADKAYHTSVKLKRQTRR